ncbi:MAG: hypothetical protein MUO59_06635, partial [Actinobacteria bacterium]|nr:hypothetical protein [Actinomycetota bacterium]
VAEEIVEDVEEEIAEELVDNKAEIAEKKKEAKVKKGKKDTKTKKDAKEKINKRTIDRRDVNKPPFEVSEDIEGFLKWAMEKPDEKVDREEKERISVKSVHSSELDEKEKDNNKTIKIEESQPSNFQKNDKVKRNLKNRIGLLYERLIDNSFQEKT